MPTTTIQSEDWITRADMATLMKKSEDTARRAEKKHNLETREDEAGRTVVHVADFLRLGMIRPQDLTVGATPAESAEVLRAREIVTQLKVQVASVTGRLSLAEVTVDTLRDQLSVKDRQLSKQAEQITSLIHSIGRIGGAA